MIGKTVSHYRVLEKLGEGGMGVVYKAEDMQLKRTVALKFLSPQVVGTGEDRARFIHEAQAAAALNHPNICTIHEIDQSVEQPFIAMECIEGRSLKSWIQSGPLKIDEAIDIAIQAAGGLQEAHEKGIVHRDIKSANIMVTTKGQVKIMDFGLAKSPDRTQLTRTGTTLGTIAYMSPEQARGEGADHRSDIWSLGVVLYEMITGGRPFKGDYDQAVLYAIMNEESEPVTSLRTGVPMELERIINKTTAKNPDERYQNAGDILVDLRSLGKKIESKPLKRPPAKEGISKAGRILIVTCVIVVVIIALYFSRFYFLPSDAEVIDSIAVLPLGNLSGDPDQDYFVEGMHEALITDLSKIGALKVISRTSVMRYKETDMSMPEIARELGVDALVEGSVLRVGDQVRITAQLIHGPTDEHLWADSYDHDLRNVLALISEVAQSIAGEIEIVLTRQEEDRLASPRTVNPEAHEAYLKGLYQGSSFTRDGYYRALDYFQEAIEIDSSFATAWAGLSLAHNILGAFGYEPVDESMTKAKAAASKALELDDELAFAHSVLGWIRLYEWNWSEAEREFKRALELNPSDAWAYHGLGDYLTVMGRLEEGFDQVVKGRDCDPFSPIAALPVAGHLYMLRRYDEMIEEAQKLLEMGPRFGGAHGWIADAYWQKGMYEEALEERKKTRLGQDAELMEALESGYAHSGPKGAMRSAAELLEARSESIYVDHFDLAMYYAGAGEFDAAFKCLEKEYEKHSPLLWLIVVYPEFDPLRSDPRFQDLLHRMGIPIKEIKK